ncbi:hypothetical protein [Methyloterricola oryzae]|uniref:hypothetical protein n=1 Tax=Methyloterricola oryzae TaxID=1495050 RepID=UPI001F36AAD7|nr:hypothetical protein [Methyloterricola oryzae]
MRGLTCLSLAFALLTCPPLISSAASDDLAVVIAAQSPVDRLSPGAIRLIFNRKSLLDGNGNRWIPVNLPPADPARRAFSQALFGAMPEEMEEYWNIEYFHGITPPEVLASEEAVLRFVSATAGAIGYVHASRADNRVKILAHVSQPLPSKAR